MINGAEYGSEISPVLAQELKANGLVAVYGASDDLMEFEGAINDEVGCWDGGMAYLGPTGLLENDCSNPACPYYVAATKAASSIEALWDEGGFSWRYKTDIPHATFVINEDNEPYCEGIVFALADVK